MSVEFVHTPGCCRIEEISMDTTYGRKGGDGPNTGKTAVTYATEAPDGRLFKRRTFRRPTSPVLAFYENRGVWYCAGVADADDPRFSTYTCVPAHVAKPWE